jgi:hypothetical protein
MHGDSGSRSLAERGKLQMDPSECLAEVMLATQKRLLKNSVQAGNYVGTFRVPKRDKSFSCIQSWYGGVLLRIYADDRGFGKSTLFLIRANPR